MSWSPSMSSISSQIQQVIVAISLAYDNFSEINGKRTASSFVSTGTSSKSLSKDDVIKFHRSIRKNRESTNTKTTAFTGSSSSSSSSCSGSSRKRSWESDERFSDHIISNSPTTDSPPPAPHTGKRSKSLVLTQELEGLCLNHHRNNSSDIIIENRKNDHLQLPLFAEMDEWAEQDFNPSSNLGKIERFEDLKRELDSCNSCSIDEVLKILSSYSGGLVSSNITGNFANQQMNHWIKWGVINEVIESLKSPEIPFKLLINRSLSLLAALHRISILLDWNDPEVLFLLNKCVLFVVLRSGALNTSCNGTSTGTGRNISNSRAVLGFIGILRVLNLFGRLPLPPSSFIFLLSRPDTSNQVIELLESLLETILTIFEYSASFKVTISEGGFDTFDLANCSVLLTLKIIEKFKLPENEEIIKKLMARIHNR